MMSDRTEGWLGLAAFIIVAGFATGAVLLIMFLWSLLQAIALLGGTVAALAAGAS